MRNGEEMPQESSTTRVVCVAAQSSVCACQKPNKIKLIIYLLSRMRIFHLRICEYAYLHERVESGEEKERGRERERMSIGVLGEDRKGYQTLSLQGL